MSYIFRGEPAQPNKAGGVLPAGDYSFVVASCGLEPYEKNGKWILAVKLAIQPGGDWIFDNPWTGETKDGEFRDGIANFLLAINRAPKVGEQPDWKRIEGARGKCRLKVEIANQGTMAGKEINRVHYYHRPKELADQLPKVGPEPPKEPDDLDMAPTDLPFRTTIYRDIKRSRLSRRYVQ